MKKKLLALLLPLALAGCIDYSDGTRVGVVTKLSHKGLFCKTWEGSMNLGGMKKESVKTGEDKDGNDIYNDQMVPNTFDFTVSDPALVDRIQDALSRGRKVAIHYRQEGFVNPCRSSSGGYFVTSIN